MRSGSRGTLVIFVHQGKQLPGRGGPSEPEVATHFCSNRRGLRVCSIQHPYSPDPYIRTAILYSSWKESIGSCKLRVDPKFRQFEHRHKTCSQRFFFSGCPGMLPGMCPGGWIRRSGAIRIVEADYTPTSQCNQQGCHPAASGSEPLELCDRPTASGVR